MKIHEYQAKDLMRRYGVAVPEGHVAFTVAEAKEAARKLPGPIRVVKAQIHAGGRGLGGGVKVCKTLDQVDEAAGAILGMMLKTHQTGPEGQLVRRLYIEGGADIRRELYLGILLDRDKGRLVVMASTEGGMNIEDVAHNTPEKIAKVWVDPKVGLQAFQCRRLGFALGLSAKGVGSFSKLLQNLYRLYTELDCSLVEVNPLIVTGTDEVMALDGKINFDDNGLFRHPHLEDLRDYDEEDPAEVEAGKFDLSYVHLDGNVGCLVNGAGLAMATMDILKHYGSEPANFLDVGGGATAEKVTAAFKIILSDERVQAIFVNIFGGIMKCDTIAEGVIAAAREVGLDRPLVVRLEGTNVELGRTLLAGSGLPITTATDMKDGAQKAVALAAQFAAQRA
ncbi:MAG: ADP-forming succinate--CoA ligase subunit beta [Deltaproteobacteria bacterium]|nr:ADP-forming succinate--CoA ligase subunit beta [Deltaproteobacteria bacterium]